MSIKGSIDVFSNNPRGKAYIEWRFPCREAVNGMYVASPSFYFLNTEWFFKFGIQVYLNSYVELFLCSRREVFDKKATFKVIIKDFKHEFTCEPYERTGGSGVNEWCDNHFCDRDQLKQLSVNGWILLTCHATTDCTLVAEAECQTASLYSSFISCGDFKDLLHDGQNADVTIVVSGEEFKAHQLILAARSPVFAAMFAHNMTEATEGVVKIDDCDPNTFHHFLMCTYTGKIENLSSDNVSKLYAVADKYDAKEIKEKCAVFMKEYLSVDTACDVIVLSERCNDIELKNSAEQFLVQNIESVLPTDKWASLMNEHLNLSSKILLQVVQNGINSRAEKKLP